MTWAGRGAWRAYSEECEVFLGGVIGTLAFLLIFKYAFFFGPYRKDWPTEGS